MPCTAISTAHPYWHHQDNSAPTWNWPSEACHYSSCSKSHCCTHTHCHCEFPSWTPHTLWHQGSGHNTRAHHHIMSPIYTHFGHHSIFKHHFITFSFFFQAFRGDKGTALREGGTCVRDWRLSCLALFGPFYSWFSLHVEIIAIRCPCMLSAGFHQIITDPTDSPLLIYTKNLGKYKQKRENTRLNTWLRVFNVINSSFF